MSKIPCADCDFSDACEVLKRCTKHDPTPPHDGPEPYTKLDIPTCAVVAHCPVCGSAPEVWQYLAKNPDRAEKAVMCTTSESFGPQEGIANDGCLLYMPPNDFYRPTIREAIKYWNDYASALTALRRKNNWEAHKAMRAAAALAPGAGRGET